MFEKVWKENILNIPDRLHTAFVLLFLFLLGTHLFDYRLGFLLPFALLLIDWKRAVSLPFVVLTLFMVSVYVTWYLVYYPVLPVPMRTWTTIGPIVWQGVLVLVMYLLGNSIRLSALRKEVKGDKHIFYVLFSFFIAYTLVIMWSYMTLVQDTPLTDKGIFVIFENAYHASGVDGGRLISTIIAYYLSFMVMLLPLLVIRFDFFKKSGFSLTEWALLVLLALSAFYLSNEMGRRTVLGLFGISLIYCSGYYLFSHVKERIVKKGMFILAGIAAVLAVAAYMMHDTWIMYKLIHKGFTDERFGWWVPGLEAMWHYPLGGAHELFVAPGMKLVHNTFIDIGKDYGIIPFLFVILFFLMHIPYFVRIVLSRHASIFVKHLIILLSIGLLTILTIEPVFNSDRVFFAYSIFFAAFLRRYFLSLEKNSF